MSNMDENLEEIKEIELKQPYEIAKTDLSKSRSKQFNLINNLDSENKLILRFKWYEFKFQEAIYCYKIIFKSSDENIKGLKIIAFDEFKRERTFKIENGESNHIGITPHMIITGFKIKPGLSVSKTSLQSIRIIGYHESDFEEIESAVSDYLEINKKLDIRKTEVEEYREKTDIHVNEKKDEISEYESLISDHDDTVKKLEEEILAKNKEKDDSTLELVEVDAMLKANIDNVKSSENNIDKLKAESKLLNEEIISNRNILQKLVNNKDLFAYEVEDYIKQGNRNIQAYTLLSFLPWVLIAYISWYLFNGAVELTNLSHENTLNTILSRIPFTLIAGAIIIVSYEISKIFVNKIIDINEQKLKFSELGIISKDTSYASADGLEIEDSEIFELRTKLKMDLLRHHLKKLDPEKYVYEINPSIWDKYTSFIKRKSSRKEPASVVEDASVDD